MAVRKLKPVTPGQRHKVIGAFDTITASTPEKSLLEPLKKSGGRNNQGRMTMRYRGGGHKRKYRVIDFMRDKDGVAAVVESIQYDPNRTARIALLKYEDGEKTPGERVAPLVPGLDDGKDEKRWQHPWRKCPLVLHDESGSLTRTLPYLSEMGRLQLMGGPHFAAERVAMARHG